jgi:MFS transporter, ACS family, glucarate transporter
MNDLSKIAAKDVGVHTGTQKKTKFRWVVALLIFVVYSVASADRSNLGMALPFIRKEFTMSNTEAGALTSLFLLAYSIAQIPSGFIFSKFGVRSIFSFAMVATSVATGLIGTTGSIFALKTYRVLLGLAEGPLPLGMTSTINHWFPMKEKGMATGIFLSAAKFGPVLVPPLCAWILVAYGWREIFYIFAVPGILLSVVWYILVKNRPTESPFCSEEELRYIESDDQQEKLVGQEQSAKKEYKLVWLDKIVRATKVNPLRTKGAVFRSWDIWGASLGYFCMVGIVNVLLAWIPTYLVSVKKFTILNLGIVAAAPWTGAIVGNMVGGWFSDKIINKRRKPNMMFSAFTSIFMMYSLVYAPNNPYMLALLMFVLGIFMNIGYSTYMVYPMALTTKETYPIASSVVNTFGQLGGAVAPLVAGIMLDHFSWNAIWIFLAGFCLICLIVLFTIKEPVEDPLI